jgi:predicted HTH transcriptional regulator
LLNDEEFWERIIIEALENKAEYNFLDFKLKLSDKNERLKEHINAFGNLERGGCLVFGVENFVAIGIDHWDEITQKVTHIAEATLEPSLGVNAFSLNVNGKKLLCLHILPGSSKPTFIKDRAPLGGAACFKRSGSSTVAMSIQEIKDLLVNAQENYYDEAIVKNAKLDELNFEQLIHFLPQLNKNEYWSSKNFATLKDYRILDGVKNSHEITVAGWLCFAKLPQEIRQFRNAYIEFQIFQSIIRDTPIKKYEIKGNLSSQIEQTINLLKQNIWLIPKIQGIKREELPAYPDVILREVITNSVVHRDYKKMHQPVKISMFSNRVEVENPGSLMPGLTIYNLIHRRDWRNPLLAELMKKFGFGEMDGQGIDRLYAATLSIKVPPPVFIDNQSSFTVVLSAPKIYEEFTPEEKRLMIIILAIMQETVDNESVRNCFGISSEKASTHIKAMVADKVLQANSPSRKYAKYILTQQYREKIFG